MSGAISFVKSWTLPISILTGIAGYYIYSSVSFFNTTHEAVKQAINIVQPILIFAMLFLTFCKIKLSQLHFTRWHLWLLTIQISAFIGSISACLFVESALWKIALESFMLCLICPTATAATVVTSKLGGNPATLTTYTIIINFAVALTIPAFLPLLHPSAEQTFAHTFMLIICKVFPLLFGPFLMAMFLRRFFPSFIQQLARLHDLAFYLWAVALSLAIAMTVRTMVHVRCSAILMLCIAIVSAAACAIQFALGRYIGRHYTEPVSAAQSLGQKNTVFAIWMGYTFLSPITSLAGGFYSVWHNIYNSWQLYRYQHENKECGKG